MDSIGPWEHLAYWGALIASIAAGVGGLYETVHLNSMVWAYALPGIVVGTWMVVFFGCLYLGASTEKYDLYIPEGAYQVPETKPQTKPKPVKQEKPKPTYTAIKVRDGMKFTTKQDQVVLPQFVLDDMTKNGLNMYKGQLDDEVLQAAADFLELTW